MGKILRFKEYSDIIYPAQLEKQKKRSGTAPKTEPIRKSEKTIEKS